MDAFLTTLINDALMVVIEDNAKLPDNALLTQVKGKDNNENARTCRDCTPPILTRWSSDETTREGLVLPIRTSSFLPMPNLRKSNLETQPKRPIYSNLSSMKKQSETYHVPNQSIIKHQQFNSKSNRVTPSNKKGANSQTEHARVRVSPV